jgi:hypothetical protein
MTIDDVIRFQFILAAISLVGAAIGAWVVYMFYARLSDIADELRRIRIAYKGTIDREEDRRERFEALQSQPPDNPFAAASDEAKYRPKP